VGLLPLLPRHIGRFLPDILSVIPCCEREKKVNNGGGRMIDLEKLGEMSPEQLEKWARENPEDAEKLGKIMVNLLEKISRLLFSKMHT